jgi:hypothetical protein
MPLESVKIGNHTNLEELKKSDPFKFTTIIELDKPIIQLM